MSPIRNMPCWEIMQCRGTEDCPAKAHPDIPCWEIAEQFGTSQNVKNICPDCIVYVVKTNDPVLSQQDIDDIMRHRNMGKFVETCPAYENRDRVGNDPFN